MGARDITVTLYKLFFFEDVVDSWAVETNDDGAVDIDDRYAHLPAFADGFLGKFNILLDIALFVFNTELIEVLLAGVAEGAPIG